jgi:hypothetical protein
MTELLEGCIHGNSILIKQLLISDHSEQKILQRFTYTDRPPPKMSVAEEWIHHM